MNLLLDTHVWIWWINQDSANLPQHHRDPADRLIIATALEHRYSLLSVDSKFELYTELADLLVSV
jgi:PIN domain nuclease of toxin-antitoxin system